MEEFRDVPNYEGLYEVSNLGTLISYKSKKPKTLKGSISNCGYRQYTLQDKESGKFNVFQAHQLVAMAFLNHNPCGLKLVVDHIDNNKLNNDLTNLQILTNRENTSKGKNVSGCYKHHITRKLKGGLKTYTYWKASIYIDNKNVYLGNFKTKEEASEAYYNKLKTI